MMTIWKYKLALTDVQDIHLPRSAQILCVQMQHGSPCLWALLDSALVEDVRIKPDRRRFFIHGTGHEVATPGLKRYVGTFQLEDGLLVFHVFEGTGS